MCVVFFFKESLVVIAASQDWSCHQRRTAGIKTPKRKSVCCCVISRTSPDGKVAQVDVQGTFRNVPEDRGEHVACLLGSIYLNLL